MMRRIKFESVRGVLRRGVVRKGNLWIGVGVYQCSVESNLYEMVMGIM